MEGEAEVTSLVPLSFRGTWGGGTLLTIESALLARPERERAALTDGGRSRAPWLGSGAEIPTGSSPIWVCTEELGGRGAREVDAETARARGRQTEED